ncbi:hypothetical protein SAMD00019534_039490, partial [Acytostelium subglobosum LB1]|uniref:hypothetical protein n=1 Tax=Acytostelium subglobosum LB1 TaxID=1410327 RepID=UPI000644B5B1
RMASVYTTKRGKTKKAKLGLRKDANNNAANKLNNKLKATTKATVAPEMPAWMKEQQQQQLKLKNAAEQEAARLALTSKCGNPVCTQDKDTTTTKQLSLCGACTSISYCCRQCQLDHWSEHKAPCKQRQLEKAEKDKAVLEAISNYPLLEDSAISNTPTTATTTSTTTTTSTSTSTSKSSKTTTKSADSDLDKFKEMIIGPSKPAPHNKSKAAATAAPVNWSLFSKEEEEDIPDDLEDE